MADTTLIYRKARSSDVSRIARLTLQTYSDFQDILTPANWNKMKAGLSNESMFADLMEKATTFVCESGDELAGVIFLVPSGNPTNIFPPEYSYIRLLGVNPNYRRLGIGRKLTALCIDHAAMTGETAIALHTSEFMAQARAMYERLGFRLAKALPDIYDKKYWLYRLDL